jgi:glyoxylase-like metal-dependent hydrolase (beta-lactamase superfamily II)
MKANLISAVLATFCLAAWTPSLAHQQARGGGHGHVHTAPVRGSVHILQGEGGNIAASFGDDGIILIDADYENASSLMLATLRDLAGARPIRYLVDTHYHSDHTDGNAAFARAGAVIVAHDEVRPRLAQGSQAGNGASVALQMPPAPVEGLPIITFDSSLTLHLNGDTITARHFARAHTDGDVVIFFRDADVVHMGDIYVRYGFPFIDLASGGSIDGMISASEAVLAAISPETLIIPGHGDIARRADLVEYVAMLRDTRAAVAAAMQTGQGLDELKRNRVLARWSERYSGDFISTDAFIETLYNSLRAQSPRQTPG